MTHRAAIAVLLFACAVTALSLLKRLPVAAELALALRALFPSWRFFESEDTRYSLLARVKTRDGALSAFSTLPPKMRRSTFSLCFAPRNNLRLACHDLVERLVLELAERDQTTEAQLTALISYQLVQNMAVYYLRKAHVDPERYQLRLLCHAADGTHEEVFTSPLYALS